ncbi:copper transporter [Gaiella sp.]|uniref:copper transporter n=1 Tax=Gaiella sp. TaxID=2663207 RepID=UPI0032638441
MFDLRYHVASLTAVFVALVIGILVGVGLSGKGFVNDAERDNLTNQISALQQQVASAQGSLDAASRVEDALRRFSDEAYPAVVPGRLDGRRVAVLFVGPVDAGTALTVRKAVVDAGGAVVRTRSIRVPLDTQRVQDILKRQPSFRPLQGLAQLGDVGGVLAGELARGEATPLWDALDETIVLERKGLSAPPVDAVVVVRTAEPQRGPTKTFLAGVYTGLARTGAPAVGVDSSGDGATAIPAFALAGLSTVDSVDTSAGRLALVLVLGGGAPGNYGVKEFATDGILPPIIAQPTQG